MVPIIDKNRRTGCGEWVEVCPSQAIGIVEGNGELCEECGECVFECPEKVITIPQKGKS
jgi:NAD-dependent dihydropyrimidine dehydrogenase PreA subunit